MAKKIADDIVFVGIDDASVRRFESQYPTPLGMSYNSYVIADEKIAVMDSVESHGGEQWLTDIVSATEGREPDYLVVHHMEPDHSANIALALHHFPDMTIVASAAALRMLPRFFPDVDFSGRTMAVKEGDVVNLGHHNLTFYAAPMVHWPEVMVSYDAYSRTLFSADAFGKFGSLQYADDWTPEARRYYVNIVGKYGAQVQSLLKKLKDLDIARIAPLHGPVLGTDLERYLNLYDAWSSYRPETEGVLVAYASIYGGTAEAALMLADSLRRGGINQVAAIDLTVTDVSEAVAQAFRLSHLVLACPTYDAGLFPPMEEFITHLASKNFSNRPVAYIENGSWAPMAASIMQKRMEEMKGITRIEPKVTIPSRVDAATKTALDELSKAIICCLQHQ